MTHTLIKFAAALVVFAGTNAHATTATFDDLTLSAPESHFSPGSTGSGDVNVNYPFTSGSATFSHIFTDYGDFGSGSCCHSGFTYTNHTDTTTAGHTNQFSAITGGGQGGSANYAIAYAFDDKVATVNFSAPTELSSAYFTNTTYATLSMQNGDGFAKKFGGTTGSDEDFYKLTITGSNDAANTGSVDFYLADYRFSDNSMDYIVTDWTAVSLASLGAVTRLGFEVTSSDVGDYGMNTPAYFAIDTLTLAAPVPEPEQAAMLVCGLAILAGMARRRSSV